MTEQQLKTLLTEIEAVAAEIRDDWGNHSSVDLDDLTARLYVNTQAVMPALGRGVVDTQ
jgi:hypothetical protein